VVVEWEWAGRGSKAVSSIRDASSNGGGGSLLEAAAIKEGTCPGLSCVCC
jgi:hypothetical protein